MSWRSTVRYFVIPAVALLLTLKIYAWINYLFSEKHGVQNVQTIGEALIGGGFTLFDQNHNIVKNTDFKNKLMLVYFGFTHCPDVCPTDLALITNVLEQLGDIEKNVQAIFITVDPERDTPEQMKNYLTSFHPSIIGLTGTKEQINEVINKYRIFAKKAESSINQSDTDKGGYQMDHSSYIYLMGKDSKYIMHFNDKQDAKEIAEKIKNNL